MLGLGRSTFGTVVGLALTICLVLVRIFLLRSTDAHAVAPLAAYTESQPSYAPAPASAWLIFATTDRDSQIRTQHARLQAESPTDGAGEAPGWLELQHAAPGDAQALLTLPSVPAAQCQAIDHVSAVFDGRKPEVFAAAPTPAGSGCSLRIAAFELFLQRLLNAQELAVTPAAPGPAMHKLGFRVGGLTWE